MKTRQPQTPTLTRSRKKKRSKGYNPYVIHLGLNHPPIGGLGYAAAAVETLIQYNNRGDLPDCVVMPSGSGLTHAGFLAGARAMGWDVPVLGICVRREAELQRQRIHKRAIEVAAMLTDKSVISEADIWLDDDSLAPGYGQMNEQVSEAILLAATTEALLLDPVYCGRTLAGLIRNVRKGSIEAGAKVLTFHTGGHPGIFAYQNDLLSLSETGGYN